MTPDGVGDRARDAAGLSAEDYKQVHRAIEAAVNYHSFDAHLEMADFDVANAILDTTTAASAPGGLAAAVERIKADAVDAALTEVERRINAQVRYGSVAGYDVVQVFRGYRAEVSR